MRRDIVGQLMRDLYEVFTAVVSSRGNYLETESDIGFFSTFATDTLLLPKLNSFQLIPYH